MKKKVKKQYPYYNIFSYGWNVMQSIYFVYKLNGVNSVMSKWDVLEKTLAHFLHLFFILI